MTYSLPPTSRRPLRRRGPLPPLGLVALALLAGCGSESGVSAGGPGDPGGAAAGAGGAAAGAGAAIGQPRVDAAGLDARIALTWADVPGATSYDVARATTAGGEVLVGNVPTPGYVDTDVTPETSYFYTVTARGGAGAGTPSPEVSARPISFDLWHQRRNSQLLRASAGGGGVTVVVGDGMRALSSTDGVTWVDRQVPGTGRLNAVTYGAGVFVAVSNSGDAYTSPDGVTWTKRSTGVAAPLTGVAYGGKLAPKFMAVGAGSTLLTSVDGITWKSVTTNLHHTAGSSFDYEMRAIAYGDAASFDYFVISAADALGNGSWIFYVDASSDLTTWMPSPAGSAAWLSSYAVTGLTFAKYGGASVVPSMHLFGQHGFWGHAEQIAPGTLSFATVTAGTAADGWWGAGFDGNDTIKIYGSRAVTCSISTTCKSGVNGWVEEPLAKPSYFLGGGFANGSFLAYGQDEVIATHAATAGATWAEGHRSDGTWDFMTINGLAGLGDRLVVVGSSGKYLYSSDRGDTFVATTAPTNAYLAAVRALGGRFYVVGNQSTILSSPDGTEGSWTDSTPQLKTTGLRDIATNGSLYVAAGGLGEVFTSTDGVTFDHVPAPGSGFSVNALDYDPSSKLFIAATDEAHILTTPDGVTWKDVVTDPTPQTKLYRVGIQDGVVLVVGVGGHVWLSTDHGVSFTPHHLPQGPTFTGLTYANDTWIAGGADAAQMPILATSPDGITWTPRAAPPALTFGMNAAAGRVFAVGYEGSIFSTY